MARGCKTGGRKKGSVNKITTAFKEALRFVYHDIGGHEAFAAWARRNQTEFYRLCGRLIPTEITTQDKSLTVRIMHYSERDVLGPPIEQDVVPMLPYVNQ
jgi:hypothetical protein